jgi:hypothetical protein
VKNLNFLVELKENKYTDLEFAPGPSSLHVIPDLFLQKN